MRFYMAAGALGLLAVVGVAAAISYVPPAPPLAHPPQSLPVVPAALRPAPTPASEVAFLAVVTDAKGRYGAAANDMAKGGIRAARKTALCRVLPQLAVRDWIGTIYKLSSNSDGNGVVELTIGPDIYVKTWNNTLSDIGDHTLIPAQSAVFQTLAAMKAGDSVKFSGTLFPGEADCVREGSMTQEGSMEEPEFIMRFFSVAAAQ